MNAWLKGMTDKLSSGTCSWQMHIVYSVFFFLFSVYFQNSLCTFKLLCYFSGFDAFLSNVAMQFFKSACLKFSDFHIFGEVSLCLQITVPLQVNMYLFIFLCLLSLHVCVFLRLLCVTSDLYASFQVSLFLFH